MGHGFKLQTKNHDALRFSAVNKAEFAWANHFLQKEQVDTEQLFLVQESVDKTEGQSPGSEITVCVLVVPLASLRIS